MLKISYLKQFKKDYKTVVKRGLKVDKLEEVLNILVHEKPLPKKYKDHALVGNYTGYRECHIEPDWILIYKIEKDIMTLVAVRTGTHSDLF